MLMTCYPFPGREPFKPISYLISQALSLLDHFSDMEILFYNIVIDRFSGSWIPREPESWKWTCFSHCSSQAKVCLTVLRRCAGQFSMGWYVWIQDICGSIPRCIGNLELRERTSSQKRATSPPKATSNGLPPTPKVPFSEYFCFVLV